MLNKKWKKFDELTVKCYFNMSGAEKDRRCWFQAFELMKEIILEERKSNPGFAPELELIDDATDYSFDIQGWLEDCLDEIDMWEDYDALLKMCDDLLALFRWPEYTGSDIKFRKSTVLCRLGRMEEAVQFSEKWMREEPENIVAATAAVYVFIEAKDYEEAEELVDKFIRDRSECGEENDIMFTAASKLYEVMGKKKEKKEIDKALEKYDEYLEHCFLEDGIGEAEDWDAELPFC